MSSEIFTQIPVRPPPPLPPPPRPPNLEAKVKETIKRRGDKDYGKYEKLRRAAADDDWHEVEKFIDANPEALTAELSDYSERILHYVVKSKNIIGFVGKLVAEMNPKDLELKDTMGRTALFNCAIDGNIKASEIMVGKNPELPYIKDIAGNFPLHYAARFGNEDMVHFLLHPQRSKKVKKEDGDNQEDRYKLESGRGVESRRGVERRSGVNLVVYLIDANLYGIARDLLEQHKMLAREPEDRKRVLETLAHKPFGFASGSQLGFWKHIIYKCIPDSALQGNKEEPDSSHPRIRKGDEEYHINTSKHCFTKCTQFSFLQRTSATCGAMCKMLYFMLYYTIKLLVPGIQNIHDAKSKHKDAHDLVKLMCKGMTWNFKGASYVLKKPMLIAARLGVQEIVDEIMKFYPCSAAIFLDDYGHNVFQLAILHRQEKVFSLIHKMGVGKDWLTNLIPDKDGNNILHLAGRMVPPSGLSGTALQIQRELKWYKVVQDLAHSSLQEQKNFNNLTPREVFTKEHIELVKAGQEWIKNTATSCSVISALIITVVFTAALTVPGGNDSQGKANYLNETFFLIFAISNALALFFSTTSVLIFLGILTSRYLEVDFLEALPKTMVMGLVTLFISIAAMMIAFVATFTLLVVHPLRWVNFPVFLLACPPVALYVFLETPLLVEMFRSTYGRSFV